MNYNSINNLFYIFVISEIGRWGDLTQNASITKHPGDYAKLTCKNAPKSVPPGVFKWYLGKQGAEGDRLFIDAEGRVILQSN